jgi:hypothetical protein
MRAVIRLLLPAMMFTSAGCGTTVIRSPTTPPGRPVVAPAAVARDVGGSIRTVCRGFNVSSFWAITDYVVSRQCETRSGITYNAMVIEDLSLYQRGARVLICANQRRPADWDYTGANVGPTNQCPHEPTNTVSSPTVVEIVKTRG